MRFFFVARLSEQGVQLMKRGARINIQDSNSKRASQFIVQAAALTQRSVDPTVGADVESMLDEIPAGDPESCGNVAMARAIFANRRGDARMVEKHARDAIKNYQMIRNKLTERQEDGTEEPKWEENSNDLSGSFQMLGNGLLAQSRATEAQTAYEKARELLFGGSVAVNEGQIFHQIGNCQSELGEHSDAADYYARAALRFQTVGMQDYLSNSMGELGYSVIASDPDVPLPSGLSSRVLTDGIEDAANSVVQCLAAQPKLDHMTRAMAIRKLFGVVAVLSFSKEVWKLDDVALRLKKWLIKTRTARFGENDFESDDEFAWLQLEALVELMSSIIAIERHAETAGSITKRDIEQLSNACSVQRTWGNLRIHTIHWLNVYLLRKWNRSTRDGHPLSFP